MLASLTLVDVCAVLPVAFEAVFTAAFVAAVEIRTDCVGSANLGFQALVDVRTSLAVARVTIVTGAGVTAKSVHAGSVLRAIVTSFETFIHVHAFFSAHDKSVIAEAVVRAFCVDAGRIFVAIVLLIHALVNVQTVSSSTEQPVFEETVFTFTVVSAFLIDADRIPATVI